MDEGGGWGKRSHQSHRDFEDVVTQGEIGKGVPEAGGAGAGVGGEAIEAVALFVV